MKKLYLLIYYGSLQFLPMYPFPGGYLFNRLRLIVVRRMVRRCGDAVVVKSRCYIGDGSRLTVGSRSQLGQGARLTGMISIGEDVLMGPDVIMMATSHNYSRLDIPMISQGEAPEREIRIGDDVWVGTRAIILPGVEIGKHSIVAAGAVVTKSFPAYSIIGGVPARLVGKRDV